MKLRSGKDFTRTAPSLPRKRVTFTKKRDDLKRVAALERSLKMKEFEIEKLNGEIDNLQFGLLLLLLLLFAFPLAIFLTACA